MEGISLQDASRAQGKGQGEAPSAGVSLRGGGDTLLATGTWKTPRLLERLISKVLCLKNKWGGGKD